MWPEQHCNNGIGKGVLTLPNSTVEVRLVPRRLDRELVSLTSRQSCPTPAGLWPVVGSRPATVVHDRLQMI